MTEADWNTCAEPSVMLEVLHERGMTSERKLRLYAAACSRLLWNLLPDERSRAAVVAAEQYADGLLQEEELRRAFQAASDASLATGRNPDCWPDTRLRLRRDRAPHQLWVAAFTVGFATGSYAGDVAMHIDSAKNAPPWLLPDAPTRSALLRCIFGNPFHRVTVDFLWLTPSVTALARDIYENRVLSELPLLADALEQAGCHEASILDHCRERSLHARGCWVVDLLLEKS
jgi:hypothetical protein